MRPTPNPQHTLQRIAETLGLPGSAFQDKNEASIDDGSDSALVDEGLSLMAYFFQVSDAEARQQIIAFARSLADVQEKQK